MAERIVSPGVFTNEVDQSFLPAGIAAIGAAVVGPTQKGPAMVPTVVSSYSEFLQKFGGSFSSGSGASENEYKYLTNYSAQEYLKYADTLTVVRILAGDYAPASSSVQSGGGTQQFATADIVFTTLGPGDDSIPGGPDEGSEGIRIESPAGALVLLIYSGSSDTYQSVQNFGKYSGPTLSGLVNLINNTAELSSQFSASFSGATLSLSSSVAGTEFNGYKIFTGSLVTLLTETSNAPFTFSGGVTQAEPVFTLTTLADGADQNSYTPTEGVNGLLASGSNNNIRWEIVGRNETKGTFGLSIRRGNDTNRRKVILEQYNNLTLDPNSPNYIARVLGDQFYTLADAGSNDPYLQLTGDYVNRSKYVRVSVARNTINYLDENGLVRDASLSYLIPANGSGSFGGGSDGTITHPIQFNENISDTNTQGFNLAPGSAARTSYIDAIRILKNQDEYDINLLTLPGLMDNLTNHAAVLTEAQAAVEERADCFLVIDPVSYGTPLATATATAEGRDSNYVAEYWPWVKIPDNDLGRNVWVPASTLIPSVYAFNDRVAAPWFAPAGLNRGALDIAVQTERKLTLANRDTLYDSNLNPIATFPNSGVVVFGQKTLQKKASALDRVNVRRLLIAAKKFIASTTKFIVFEQNTAATRNRFLSIVNPYFENVQQRQGLYAFKVVMDETNNTPDVIDRNQMVGQIYLQPAKTAEFIIIDFNILPTGAAFPE